MTNESLTQSQREAMRVKGVLPTMWSFISNHWGWIFNFTLAHILFWVYGFTALLEYGYSDFNQDSNGQIVSGPSGSGVGIVSTILAAGATIIVLTKAVSWDPNANL